MLRLYGAILPKVQHHTTTPTGGKTIIVIIIIIIIIFTIIYSIRSKGIYNRFNAETTLWIFFIKKYEKGRYRNDLSTIYS